ncbi:hypothetical protein GGX14DRAFT_661269 [Mycena pura]|uniref:Uncharacterized protein n=1 Tax=Mycena pura TaxID=153505 RepID=A0AAD6V573_9AGAR|nr:hypothetical protein GGX14DRAFT_661269 [Mycena pura]
MRRLKRLKIRSTLSDIPKMLRRILPQLQLSPARHTLESIILNFFCTTGYDAQMWISVDEMLADVATYPCLRTIVISTSIDSFLDYSLSSMAQHCNNMPFALALHEHLRQCSDRGLLRVDIPITLPVPTIIGDDEDEGTFFAANASTAAAGRITQLYPRRAPLPAHAAFFPSAAAAYGEGTTVSSYQFESSMSFEIGV